MASAKTNFDDMSVPEQILHVQELWDRIAARPESVPVPDAAKEGERQRFLELADRLARVRDPEEQARIKEELAHMTFGD